MSRRTESPYASLARPAKRDRIVAAIDADFALHGRPLFGAALLSQLRAAPEAFWAAVGTRLGSRKAPSVATRELVLAVYAYRTEGDRLAREYLARTLGQVAA
jgi:hypothetical protein